MKRILCVIFLSVFLFCGCEFNNHDSEKSFSRDIFAMDTFMTIKAYGENSENAVNSSVEKIRELENLFSVTQSGSDIFRINNAGGKMTSVSDDTYSLVTSALDICRKTDGALDISVYPIVKEWGFTSSEYKVPDEKTISELLEKVDYTKIITQKKMIGISDGMEIDLGSAAKGYAGRCIYDIMRDCSIESAVINLGGNVQTVGSQPDGTMWNVGIENPFIQNESICILNVSDEAVVTSGNYERFFTDENGKKYCHIIDTSNGFPVDNGLVSVTVIGKDGTLCDLLSTALFVMGKDKAIEYYRKNDGFEVVFITDNEEIFITNGISERITIDEKYKYSVVSK